MEKEGKNQIFTLWMRLAEVLWLIKLNLIAPSPSRVDPPTFDNPDNYTRVVTLLSYRLGHTCYQ